MLQPNSGSTIERRIRRTTLPTLRMGLLLSLINHACNRKLLTYAILIQDKQSALDLPNNKQTIYMSLSVQPNSRKEKMRNPQLSQFDPVTQIMLPNGVPTLNVINQCKY